MTYTIDSDTKTIRERSENDSLRTEGTIPERYDNDSDNDAGTNRSLIVPQTPHLNEIIFDVSAAYRQLGLLGFRPDEVPYLRAFPAKGDPRGDDIKNSRSNNRSRQFDPKEIEKWNREGLGVYITINAGGSKKADIEECRAIFYEHDHMPKEEQIDLWESLGLPEPTFQIDTGGKSIHTYWVFVRRIATSDWSYRYTDKEWYGLQADLIAHAGADTALIDLPRVMRLAGCFHIGFDQATNQSYVNGQSVIINASDKRYSYEELRTVIPERVPPEPAVSQPVQRRDTNNDTCTPPRTVRCTSTDSGTDSKSDSDTALDFRTVSQRLPHWNEDARPGWSAFQCPVHTRDGKPHSFDSIHVNRSSGKWKAQCGCDRKEIYAEVCRMVGFVSPKPERMPTFGMLNDGSLIPAYGEDEAKAMAYLAIPENEAKVRAKIAARYAKNDNGNGIANGKGNDSSSKGNGSGGKKGSDSGSGKPPNINVYASHMKEQYGKHYRYCDEESQWYAWEEKKWEPHSDNLIDVCLLKQVESEGFIELSPNYIDNIRKYLKRKVTIKQWREWDRSKYVAFANGILEIDSSRLLPHSPESGFTSFLPFDYSPLLFSDVSPIESLKANCPHVYEFFNRAMRGHSKRILKLLATINATIKHRFHDLQLFTHIQGDPGTGKNTFTNLLGKIVGEENRLHTNPKALEKPDELAAVVTKQLVVCPDVRKQVENVQAFLNLTGGTPIHYRKLFKDRGEKKFYGHLVVVSNTPIFAGDTTGIDRRLNLIEFNNPIPPEKRDGAAEALYDAELPNLIQVALSLSDKAVSDLLKGVGAGEIPEYRQLAWETRIGEDSMAAWANEYLIRDPKGMIPIGDGNRTTEGNFKTLTAYGSYRAYCEEEGNKFPATRETFCRRLQNMIQQAIGWKEVKKRKSVNIHVYVGVRLRQDSDNAIPFVSDLLGQEAASRAVDMPASYWVCQQAPETPIVDGGGVSPASDNFASKLPGTPIVDGVSISPATPAKIPQNSETQKSISTDTTLSNQLSSANRENVIEVGKNENVAGLLAKAAQGDDDNDSELAGNLDGLLAKCPTDEASELAGNSDGLLEDDNKPWYPDDDYYEAMDRYYASEEGQRELLEAHEDLIANIDMYMEQARQWQIEAIGIEAYEAMCQCDREIYGGVPAVTKSDGDCDSLRDAATELAHESGDSEAEAEIESLARSFAHDFFCCGTVDEAAACIESLPTVIRKMVIDAASWTLEDAETRVFFDALVKAALEHNEAVRDTPGVIE